MKVLLRRICSTLLILIACNASAHNVKIGDLIIKHPYINETPPSAVVAGGYLSIKNTGKTDVRLLSVNANFAAMIQIHQTSIKNDIAQMQEMSDGVVIPAGQTIKLQHGGMHIMFMRLKKNIKAEREYAATLVFEKAGEIKVYFEGKKIGGKHH